MTAAGLWGGAYAIAIVASCFAMQPGNDRTWFLSAAAVAFVAHLGLLHALLRRSERRAGMVLVVSLAIIARIAAFFIADAQYLSDDVNRYVFEGHVVLDGGDPYRFPPDSPVHDELTERHGIGDIRAAVNNRPISTIYPPLAEALFAAGAAISSSVTGFRIVILVFDVATFLIVLAFLRQKKRRPEWVLLYALSPLLVIEAMVSSHVDQPAACLLVAALLCFSREKHVSGWLLVGASALVKVFGVVAAPFVLRPQRFLAPLAFLLPFVSVLPFTLTDFGGTPRVPDGTWRIVGSNEMARAKDQVLEMPGREPEHLSRMLRSASNDIMFSRPDAREVLIREDVAPGPAKWNEVLGRYHLSLPEGLREVFLDGTGSLRGDLEGRYWLDGDVVVLAPEGADQLRFRMTVDRHGLLPEKPGGPYGLKYDEPPYLGLSQYATRWSANNPFYRWFEERFGSKEDPHPFRRTARLVLMVLLGGLALGLVLGRCDPVRATAVMVTALVLLSPAIYPWYLLPLIPLLAVRPSAPLILLSGTVLATYASPSLTTEIIALGLPAALAVALWVRRIGRSPETVADP